MKARETRASPDGVELAPAVPEQAALLTGLAFRSKSHWGYPVSWLEEWRPTLTVTGEQIASESVVVARLDAAVVGFYALHVDGARASVEHLWVEPAAMGRGVGRALFAHAAAEAASRGCDVLEIDSDPNAEPFYVAMGAVRTGTVAAPVAGLPRELPRLELRLARRA